MPDFESLEEIEAMQAAIRREVSKRDFDGRVDAYTRGWLAGREWARRSRSVTDVTEPTGGAPTSQRVGGL